MRNQPCVTCDGRGGASGPCPECGVLPSVEVVGVEETRRGEVHRVTTPRRARRGAIVVVGLLVALLGSSLLVDGRSDEAAAPDESADGPRSSDRPRHRATTTTLPPPLEAGRDQPGDAALVLHEAIDGFAGQWLLLVDHQRQRHAQLSLDGGALTWLGRIGSGEDPAVVVDAHLVMGSGGFSLRDGSWWRFDNDGRGASVLRRYVLGVTSDGSVLVVADDGFQEYSGSGELLAEHRLPIAVGHDSWPRVVVGRTVIYQGSQGLISFDLDSGRVRRFAVGTLVGVAGERAVVGVCDAALQECVDQLVHVVTGEVVTELGPSRQHARSVIDLYWVPTGSPDGSRLVLAEGDDVILYDTEIGTRLAVLPMGLGERGLQTSALRLEVLWAPDSETALVLVLTHQAQRARERTLFAATVARDGATVDVLDSLGPVLDPVLPFGSFALLTLVPEPLEPLTRGG
jgi:hypothetical protein